MSPDCQERNKVTSKLTGKDGLLISEFTSDKVVCNLKDLTTNLKVMQKNLNQVLTDLVKSNSTIEVEAEVGENEEEDGDDDDDDDDDENTQSNVLVRKRKKSEPDKEIKTKAVKMKL